MTRVRFVYAASAVFVFGAAGASRAALITPVTSAPTSDPTSVFDASHTGNTYSLATGTTLIPAGFDIRDVFGGSFGTFNWEHNDVLFSDAQPAGTVEQINVSLVNPVSLGSFNFYLEDDGSSGNRSASEFLLFANNTLLDDVHILDNTGSQSYTSVYGNNYINISDVLNNAPIASNYTLELVQNQAAGSSSGIRALEFTAAPAASPSAAVPEPGSLSLLGMASASLLLRRRKVAA